jgi:Tol biopolymer transport system component
VADINAPFLANSVAPCFAWFPDGKWVVIDGLALLSIESGEKRSLTSPPNSQADFSPAVSPDGRAVAFSRTVSFGVSDIYLLELTANFKPTGRPRRLTSLKSFCFGPTWVPSGREIVFASSCVRFLGSGMRLWKTEASGGKEPEQLPFTGGDVCWPTFSGQGNRMAYQRCIFDSNIWRLSLSSPGVATGRPVRFIHSTHLDENPQYSADGKRISFESARSGMYCIWVSDADSSNTVELISRAGAPCGSAQWSPDGQRVAFDFSPYGMFDIYVMRASRGKPIRLTTDPTNASSPTWSRDGKWVYFGSERTGRSEVWKVSAEGGEAFQVTRNGGETAFESPDGQSLYYTKSYFSSGLWKMSVGGGEERQVLPSVVRRAFSLVKDGIYFIPEPDNDGMSSVQFLSFAAGKVQKVTPISGSPTEGLSVSPDGRFLLFSQLDEASSDLMLVENFQ